MYDQFAELRRTNEREPLQIDGSDYLYVNDGNDTRHLSPCLSR